MNKIVLAFVICATFSVCFSSCSGGHHRHSQENVVYERYVHKYGVEVPADYWETRGKDGQVISTTTEGITVSRTYKEGILDGETTFSFPHTQIIQRTEIYRDGELVKITENNPSGIPFQETEIVSLNQKKVCKWYEEGTPLSVEEYEDDRLIVGEYYNPSNQLESRIEQGGGARTKRDPYGKLIATDTFEDGRLISSMTNHENGNPKELTPYQNEVSHGEKRTYHLAGEPNAIEQWVEGKQHGPTVLFQNGALWAEVPYVNGKKQGTEYRFNVDQVLVEEINWDKDKQHGPSYIYVRGHKTTEWYFHGKRVTKATHDQFRVVRSPKAGGNPHERR